MGFAYRCFCGRPGRILGTLTGLVSCSDECSDKALAKTKQMGYTWLVKVVGTVAGNEPGTEMERIQNRIQKNWRTVMSKTTLLINSKGEILDRGAGSDMLAKRDEEGGIVVAAAEDLEAVTGSVLADMYNARVPESDQIKKFSTKAEGAERVWDLLQNTNGADAPQNTEEPVAKKKATKKAAKKKATKAKASNDSKPGRTSSLAGKKAKITDTGKERNRREGSRRTASFNAITTGMLYETAIEKGAHPTDIAILTKMGDVEWE